jgi:serine protease inhibitor
VVVLAESGRDAAGSLRCLERPLVRQAAYNVTVVVPKLTVESTHALTKQLSAIGIGAIFNAATDSFPEIAPHQGVSEVIQGTVLGLDEFGISVRASTTADISLSNGHPIGKIVFDHPFVVRVVDETGGTVALAAIDDLRR